MNLYIIGNGFDLNHGLKTSYHHYRNFLRQKYPFVLNEFNNFQYFTYGGCSEDELWINLKISLTLNYSDMLSNAIENGYPDLNNESDSRWYEIQYDLENQTQFISDFTRDCFYDWLSSIDTSMCFRRLNLNSNALFITFNYTNTLEYVYSINPNRILHIHGAWISYEPLMTSSIQFGSIENNPQNAEKDMESQYSGDDFYNVSIRPGVDEIVGFCSASAKNIKQNYTIMSEFISSYQIDEIIIMGHSFLGIDAGYYNDILIPRYHDCRWTIYVHTKDDCDNAKLFISNYGIKNFTIRQW